jgi:hypothetical protein
MWPVVAQRLVDLLPTLPGWADVKVFDGSPATEARPTKYVLVGAREDDETAGSFTQEPSPVGNTFFDETGSVASYLVCQTGSSTLRAVRDEAFTLAGALQQHLRTEPLLAVLPTGSTTSLEIEVQSRQRGGSGQALLLTLSYTAPIT